MLHAKLLNPIYCKFGQLLYMEAKESDVEARTAVLLIDVNDYLPRDDLPFLLLCSLASSQHAKPEVVE